MRKPIVGVRGPGEGAHDNDINVAKKLGELIGKEGWILLTGGRNSGVMHAATQGAKETGGTTIGIIPGTNLQGVSHFVDIPILTGMGNARNNINVLSSNLIIAIGIGPGTLSEIALGIKNEKKIVLMNINDSKKQFFKQFTSIFLLNIRKRQFNMLNQFYFTRYSSCLREKFLVLSACQKTPIF